MTPINPSGLWKKRLGDWVLNPYVGCEHGCYHCYCPAMPGVKFNNHGHKQSDWGTYLYPKVGIVEALRQQVLLYGLRRSKRFIAWPDTQRLWARHLSPEQNKNLEQFLPPVPAAA